MTKRKSKSKKKEDEDEEEEHLKHNRFQLHLNSKNNKTMTIKQLQQLQQTPSICECKQFTPRFYLFRPRFNCFTATTPHILRVFAPDNGHFFKLPTVQNVFYCHKIEVKHLNVNECKCCECVNCLSKREIL